MSLKSQLQDIIANNVIPELIPEFREGILQLKKENPDDELVAYQIESTGGAIELWDKTYREGSPTVDDDVFDIVFDFYKELIDDPNFSLYIGVVDDRKELIPVIAASMNKCKTIEELKKWSVSKGFNFEETEFVISPKLDGITLINDEVAMNQFNNPSRLFKTWTKSRDSKGLFVPDHMKYMNNGEENHVMELPIGKNDSLYTRGEAIMKKSVFYAKYTVDILGEKMGYKNPRNLVGGKFNDKTPDPNILRDIDFVRFHVDDPNGLYKYRLKSTYFDMLNDINSTKIPYLIIDGKNITEDKLNEIYKDFNSQEYEIDGLIIEINSMLLRNQLGLETSSNNPCFARAYKNPSFDEYADTEVVEIKRQITKRGYLKPVIVIKPVRLSGVTVTNIFADNERWLYSYGVGVGTKLTVKRSGAVIPRITHVENVKVLPADEFKKIADNIFDGESENIRQILGTLAENRYSYPYEYTNGTANWNETKVEIVLTNIIDEVQIMKNVFFFTNIGCDGVGEGYIKELYERGFQTIGSIIKLIESDTAITQISSWESWGTKKAENFVNSIKKSLGEVELNVLMHSTGLFENLGSTKIALVPDLMKQYQFNELLEIDGFAEISAKSYLDGYSKFWLFVAENNIKVNIPKKTSLKSNKLANIIVVWTGFRDKIMESKITENGGTVGSSVSSKTTHLVMKEIGSGSTKEQKAEKLGIKIYNKDTFNGYINSLLVENNLF